MATRHYILNTPKLVLGIGALREADSDRPTTVLVSAGSMIPSSHKRALAKYGCPSCSNLQRETKEKKMNNNDTASIYDVYVELNKCLAMILLLILQFFCWIYIQDRSQDMSVNA